MKQLQKPVVTTEEVLRVDREAAQYAAARSKLSELFASQIFHPLNKAGKPLGTAPSNVRITLEDQ